MIGRHLAAAAVVAVLSAAVYGTIAWGMIGGSNDFKDHLDFARRLYQTGRPPVPHFLFHALTAGLVATTLVHSYDTAARLLMVGVYLLTALVTYGVYWRLLRDSPLARPAVLGALVLGTLAAQPITAAHAYALGYLWPEPYHSPTFALLKPFALAGFAGVALYLSRRDEAGVRAVALALVTVASALAKPSFMICVLPAATILAAYRMIRQQPISVTALLWGFYLPAAAVLAWQFSVTFAGAGVEGMYRDSVAWAPLKFMNHWATGLPLKFLASLAFPLVVTTLDWPRARRDTMLQLGWLCFLFGAICTYALIEKNNWQSGNFVWSGYITLFTLFVAATAFWFRHATFVTSGWPRARTWICAAVLALHVLSGARLDWVYLAHYGCGMDYDRGDFVCK